MPGVKGSPVQRPSSPSPVKRKKSLARSPSQRTSPTPRSKDGHAAALSAESQLRGLSGLDPAKKPPRAPHSHAPAATGESRATTESSPADSLEATPRPASPVLVNTRPSALGTARGEKEGGKDRERVRVFVRLRPMREGEGESTLRLDGTNTRLWLSGERTEKNDAGLPLQFDFDGVLPSDVAQQDVYETVARPLVDAAP